MNEEKLPIDFPIWEINKHIDLGEQIDAFQEYMRKNPNCTHELAIPIGFANLRGYEGQGKVTITALSLIMGLMTYISEQAKTEKKPMTDEQLITEMAQKDPEALAKTYADMKGEISRLKQENETLRRRLELADEALCIAQSYRGN